jgi:hypothetical protein
MALYIRKDMHLSQSQDVEARGHREGLRAQRAYLAAVEPPRGLEGAETSRQRRAKFGPRFRRRRRLSSRLGGVGEAAGGRGAGRGLVVAPPHDRTLGRLSAVARGALYFVTAGLRVVPRVVATVPLAAGAVPWRLWLGLVFCWRDGRGGGGG